MLRLFHGRQRDALDAVGTAGIEGAFGDEVVVVDAHLSDPKARGFERVEIALAWNRAGDAGGPELNVASRPFLQWAAADDVGDRESSAGSKDARRFREDAVLDGREI